jgi:hypothetical protein
MLVPHHRRCPEGLNELVSLARRSGPVGASTIRHLHEAYRVEVSPELVSRITDTALPTYRSWRRQQAAGPSGGYALLSAVRSRSSVRSFCNGRASATVTPIGSSGALLGDEALIESQTQIGGSVVRLVGRG